MAGIKALYQDAQGGDIEGKKNVSSAGLADYHSQDVRFNSGDFLKELSGTFDKTETFVQSLSFVTSHGETHKVGDTTSPGKPFKFDINEYEFPAVIFGALEIEYSNFRYHYDPFWSVGNLLGERDDEKQETGSRLTKIGLLIKSDAVEERIELNADQGRSNAQKTLTKSPDIRLSAALMALK